MVFFFTMAALNDDDLVDYEEEEAPKPPMVNSQQSITSLVNSMNMTAGIAVLPHVKMKS